MSKRVCILLLLVLAGCLSQPVAPVKMPPLPGVGMVAQASTTARTFTAVVGTPTVTCVKLCCSAPISAGGYSFAFQSSPDRQAWQTVFECPYPQGAWVRYVSVSTNAALYFRAVVNSTNVVSI